MYRKVNHFTHSKKEPKTEPNSLLSHSTEIYEEGDAVNER